MLDHAQTAGQIGNEIPDTGLFVTADGVGDVPEQVAMDVVVRGLLQFTALGGVVDTVPAGAETDGRAEPLADGDVRANPELAEAIVALEDGVHTGAEADEHVVESAVGHIGTTDDLTIRTAVGILLRKSVEGKEKTCSCKDSDEFDDFHDTIIS